MRLLLVTGGSGFIGSNFIRFFLSRNKNFIIVNMDKLTYASDLNNLKDLENSPRYHFIKGDICNREFVDYVLRKYRPGLIVNFAAESDMDRSIGHPSLFAETNIMGTLALLESARFIWSRNSFAGNCFLQVSTGAVYGSLDKERSAFTEESPLLPSNPFSSSKAGADMMIRAFSSTFKLPAIITRCCNNYGPCQRTDNFIPHCITCALTDQPIRVFGDGSHSREWMHVRDHCIALTRTLFYGKAGETYNIGTGHEISNLNLAEKILKLTGKPQSMVRFTADKSSHEMRYLLDSSKARKKLGWSNKVNIDEGLADTIKWYRENRDSMRQD